MALRKARFRPGGGLVPLVAGYAGTAVLAASLVGIGGCTPTIEAYRSLAGLSKDDPNPATAPFTGNLAKAEAEPYPNLASVPPPPSDATTAAERQKLTQSLVSDRAATTAAGIPPPGLALPAATPPPAAAANGGPAVPGAPGKAAAVTSGEPVTPNRAREAPPQNSTLEMPQLHASLPQPESPRPPPPLPALAAIPPPPPEAALPPAAAATAMPAPAPPPPMLAPPAAAIAVPHAASATTTVATLELPNTGDAASPADRAQIAAVAARYKQSPAPVRVVAYGAAPAAGGDPLASYQSALDRAQAVAKALAVAGIPAAKIQTEASPAAGPGRVEIQFAR
jgi:hypothetical protein